MENALSSDASFFPPFCRFGNSNRDKSRQKIRFHAHLFSKVAEVSEVWLLHFFLRSFLWDVDKMRNLKREMKAPIS